MADRERLKEFVTGNGDLPPIRRVIVGNDREFFSPVDDFVPADVREEFVEADIDEADMDFMWHGDDKIVFLPRAVDPDFLADISRLFGFRNVRLLVPHETGAGLSADIISDKGVFQELVEAIKISDDVQIIPFGHTLQFQLLIESLRRLELEFGTPETSTKEGVKAEAYFETKAGSRELMLRVQTKHPEIGVKIPEGFICDSVAEALEKVDYFLQKGKGVVLKANSGGAGVGVYVYKPEQLDTESKIAEMRKNIIGNELFQCDKVIVEERVDADFAHHGTYPSVDAIVREDGAVEIQAIDAMVIRHDGEEVGFYGCIAGKGLFDSDRREKLRAFTFAVGEELSAAGYRGWFDTDYILATDGTISPTEANLRNTSMTYVVDLAKLLFGDGWEDAVSIRTNDKFIRKNLDGVTYAQLKESLAEIMFPVGGLSEGVVITESMRSKFGRGKFGYAIFGASQDRTREIEEDLERRVDKFKRE